MKDPLAAAIYSHARISLPRVSIRTYTAYVKRDLTSPSFRLDYRKCVRIHAHNISVLLVEFVPIDVHFPKYELVVAGEVKSGAQFWTWELS